MSKLLVGILKGAVIGGALGYGAHALGQSTGFDNPWIVYGLIGAIYGGFVELDDAMGDDKPAGGKQLDKPAQKKLPAKS